MSGIDTVLHPTFEALSAHADSPDDVAAATRVGRHVARCVRCREEVAEIRALGDAARAMAVAGAPADLWPRIERAAATGRGTRAHAPPVTVAADVAAPAARRHRALAATACMLGMVVGAVVLWPRPSLQAAGPNRLTFTPRRPVPGGVLRVRYLPPTPTADGTRLVLLGRFMRPAGHNPVLFGVPWASELADSLGELTRTPDGAFVASITLPENFLAVSVAVGDPRTGRVDLDDPGPWSIIGGTAAHEPSLAAFLAATETPWTQVGWDGSRRARQMLDVADSLKRYFPRHPAGWAYTRSYGVARGRFDFLRFFESADRKYASMAESLWPQPALDAERLHAMVVFAHRIDEPREMLRWADRFATEHAEDPRALPALTDAIHEIELQSPPALRDTVQRWLPTVDQAYRRGPIPNAGYEDARRLADLYGDSVTRALWASRARENGVVANIWLMTWRAPGDSSGAVAAELRRRALSACELPPGKFPLTVSVARWRSRCEFFRELAYASLSSATLHAGNARLALEEADSALAAVRRGEMCVFPRGYLAHASASLALGDTVTAESDFIASAVDPTRAAQLLDTAQARLGTRFDRQAATIRLDSARLAVRGCVDRARARRDGP